MGNTLTKQETSTVIGDFISSTETSVTRLAKSMSDIVSKMDELLESQKNSRSLENKIDVVINAIEKLQSKTVTVTEENKQKREDINVDADTVLKDIVEFFEENYGEDHLSDYDKEEILDTIVHVKNDLMMYYGYDAMDGDGGDDERVYAFSSYYRFHVLGSNYIFVPECCYIHLASPSRASRPFGSQVFMIGDKVSDLMDDPSIHNA